MDSTELITTEDRLIEVLEECQHRIVFDTETDGLEDYTKIHCLGFSKIGSFNTVYILTDPDLIVTLVKTSSLLACHNLIDFDLPMFNTLLGANYTGEKIDTLYLSFYLYPNQPQHGLEYYGNVYNYPKLEVEDWENLNIEVYIERVARDVRINNRVLVDQFKLLKRIYGRKGSYKTAIRLLNHKATCLLMQKKYPLYIDAERTEHYIEEWDTILGEKLDSLREAMPKIPLKKTYNKPAKVVKKDGTLTVRGEAWYAALHKHGFPRDREESFEVETGEFAEPNPRSSTQVKDWLFGLGWEPCTFEYRKAKHGVNKVPQVYENGDLTPSVARLIKKEPTVEYLADAGIYKNRLDTAIKIVESLDEDNRSPATYFGTTNTLRVTHKAPFTNIPKNTKKLGKEIRSLIRSPEDMYIVGADISSLEDSTKQHFMFPYDREYVEEMQEPGFDPHLDIALLAGYITKKDIEEYKAMKKDMDRIEGGEEQKREAFKDKIDWYDRITELRSKGKTTNFASLYGVKELTLSRTSGMSIDEAKKLLRIYDQRNWALKRVVDNIETQEINGQLWLLNPVSNVWYELRNKKDIFSTLNQGTGAYIFDLWLAFAMKAGLKLSGQFHDELISFCKKEDKDKIDEILKTSMDKVNDLLSLNVTIKIDVKFGKDYSSVH